MQKYNRNGLIVTMIRAMLTIVLLALFSWLFKVDFQLLLLMSIAYDTTYVRLTKENGGAEE